MLTMSMMHLHQCQQPCDVMMQWLRTAYQLSPYGPTPPAKHFLQFSNTVGNPASWCPKPINKPSKQLTLSSKPPTSNNPPKLEYSHTGHILYFCNDLWSHVHTNWKSLQHWWWLIYIQSPKSPLLRNGLLLITPFLLWALSVTCAPECACTVTITHHRAQICQHKAEMVCAWIFHLRMSLYTCSSYQNDRH